MKRCPYCQSIFVCWNWIISPDSTTHECWDCSNCFHTDIPVESKITYEEICALYKEKTELFTALDKINQSILEKMDQIIQGEDLIENSLLDLSKEKENLNKSILIFNEKIEKIKDLK